MKYYLTEKLAEQLKHKETETVQFLNYFNFKSLSSHQTLELANNPILFESLKILDTVCKNLLDL